MDSDEDDDGSDDDGSEMQRRPHDSSALQRHRNPAHTRISRGYTDDEMPLAQHLMARLRFAGPPRRSLRLTAAKRPQAAPTCAAPCKPRCAPAANQCDGYWREPGDRDAADGADPRRQRLDGALRPSTAALRPCGRCRSPTGRGVCARHPPDPGHQGTEQPRPGQSAAPGQPAGHRLERRHPPWRSVYAASTINGACAAWHAGRSSSSSATVGIVANRRLLAEQMQRLQRITHSFVWVNPLKVTPGYAPLARGMAAALPYVDHFVEGHSVAAMEELARVISEHRGDDRGATCVRFSMTSIAGAAAVSGVAVARVVNIEGSGPRDPGAAMAVNEDGEVAGSVSGGCVEGAVVGEALAILHGDQQPRLVTFGYSDDDAFAVGLTCGGTIHLFIEPLAW